MTVGSFLLISCLGCYLIGGIPFGLLVGLAQGVDIRRQGSGNIGATNVGRVLGRKWGVLVFVLDACKGLIPIVALGYVLRWVSSALGLTATGANLLWLAGGMCCVLGHNFPPYLRFRGGKGVATSLGVVLGVFPYLTFAGLMAFVIWTAVTLTTRYVSLGSVVAAASLPVLVAGCTLWQGYSVFIESWPLVAFSVLAATLVVYRHRENLSRLRLGNESRLGSNRSH